MRLMIACPATHVPVPTGIETERESLMTFPNVRSVVDPCLACGGKHSWRSTDTRLEDEWRAPVIDAV
jgi:hypothetical protein